jgi:hypothetical protein
MRFLVGFVLLIAVCAVGRCATIQTTDGRAVEGDLRFEAGQVVVRQGGKELRLEPAQIKQITSAPAEKHQPPSPAEKVIEKLVVPSPQGLKGEYFADPGLKDLKLTRLDPRIEFSWDPAASPDPSVPAMFHARWSGQIEAPHTETYTFFLNINEGARLWVADKLLIDKWNGPPKEYSASIPLKKAEKTSIKLEFRKGKSWGLVHLHWQSPRVGRQPIPPDKMFPGPGISPPAVKIISPGEADHPLASSAVPVEALAADSDGSVERVEFFADNISIGAANRAPWTIGWKAPKPGQHRLYAIATDNAHLTSRSPEVACILSGNGDGTLPREWAASPVGSHEHSSGTVSFAEGVFHLESAKGSIEEGRDSFHFVHQKLSGDGAVIARLDQFDASGGLGFAGLMIRENLHSEHIREAFLGLAGEQGLIFLRRETPWEGPRISDQKDVKAPCWLKLLRYGMMIRAYQSEDGSKWHLAWQSRVEMGKEAMVGLAIAGSAKECRARFSHVQVIPGPPPQESTIRGVLLSSGTLIAGDVRGFDGTSIRIARPGGEIAIPATSVARLLFRPLTQDAIETLGEGRTGVILANGDFFDGTVAAVDGGELKLSSVLFGVKKFNVWDQQVVATILRDPSPHGGRFTVTGRDGTVCKAKSIRIEKDRLIAVDPSGIELSFGVQELAELKAQ